MTVTTQCLTGLAALCLLLIPVPLRPSGTQAQEPETHALFDGETLNGWRAYQSEEVPEGWNVADGAIHFDGGDGDLMTVDQFANFELTLEWKISAGGNSGVMYRVSTGDRAPYVSGPEYQILDNAAHADGGNVKTSAGALYGLYDTDPEAAKPAGEWNTTKIVINGNSVEHWLNGTQVVQCELHSEDWNERVAVSKFASWQPFGKNETGHIVLQDHGDEVWYRNITLRELP